MYLINEGSTEGVLRVKNMFPKGWIPPADQMPGSILEQRVLVTHSYQLHITLSPLIRHTRQMRVPLLTVLPNHIALIESVLSEEPLRVVVAIDIDLGQGVVCRGLIDTLMGTAL